MTTFSGVLSVMPLLVESEVAAGVAVAVAVAAVVVVVVVTAVVFNTAVKKVKEK